MSYHDHFDRLGLPHARRPAPRISWPLCALAAVYLAGLAAMLFGNFVRGAA